MKLSLKRIFLIISVVASAAFLLLSLLSLLFNYRITQNQHYFIQVTKIETSRYIMSNALTNFLADQSAILIQEKPEDMPRLKSPQIKEQQFMSGIKGLSQISESNPEIDKILQSIKINIGKFLKSDQEILDLTESILRLRKQSQVNLDKIDKDINLIKTTWEGIGDQLTLQEESLDNEINKYLNNKDFSSDPAKVKALSLFNAETSQNFITARKFFLELDTNFVSLSLLLTRLVQETDSDALNNLKANQLTQLIDYLMNQFLQINNIVNYFNQYLEKNGKEFKSLQPMIANISKLPPKIKEATAQFDLFSSNLMGALDNPYELRKELNQKESERITALADVDEYLFNINNLLDKLNVIAIKLETSLTETANQLDFNNRIIVILINILFLLFIFIFGLFIFRSIANSLDLLTGAMKQMVTEEGVLNIHLEKTNYEDLNEVVGAFNTMSFELHNTQKNLQERTIQLIDQNEQLETAMDKLTRAQNQIIQQEKLASIGLLSAGVAHELKNPLNFVVNFTDLSNREITKLVKEFEDPSKMDIEKIKYSLKDLQIMDEKIRFHGKRANDIINNMLSKARQGVAIAKETSVEQLIDQAVQFIEQAFKKRDPDFTVSIVKKYDPGIEPIEVFPEDLVRVFINLIDNTFYALLEKQKNIGKSFVPQLAITLQNMQNEICISLKDNGTGISKENINKIFQPFFTTKPTGSGTGLGLYICYDIIIQQHKGKFEAQSVKGEYTEFIIHLPKIMAPK